MISPEEGFHQREQEAMHFKYSAKISEKTDEAGGWGGVGGHTAALKAYYSSETNNRDFLMLYLFFLFMQWHIHRGVCLKQRCSVIFTILEKNTVIKISQGKKLAKSKILKKHIIKSYPRLCWGGLKKKKFKRMLKMGEVMADAVVCG